MLCIFRIFCKVSITPPLHKPIFLSNREENVDEFHDAREIPDDDGSIKKCPECSIDFPPTFPEVDFVMHIQQHFARQCPMCQILMAQETAEDQEAFTKHVQTHFRNDDEDQVDECGFPQVE